MSFPQAMERRAAVPYIILLAGLAMTIVAAVYAHRAGRAQQRLSYGAVADGVRHALDTRIEAYVAMLRGGAALFAASSEVRLREFRAYVSRLELTSRYPGIQGIGFSRVVRVADRDRLRAQLREEGLEVSFWPESAGEDIHAIVFLEPLDARNRIALGFNMFSEPLRREAMTRARDSGAPAATRPLRLVQEGLDPEHPQPGFLIYLPIYEGGGVPPTEDERRARLFGFVYSPFRAEDFLRSTVPDAGRQFSLSVYDGDPAQGQVLHEAGVSASSDVAIEVTRVIHVAGRAWTLRVRPYRSRAITLSAVVVLLVAVAGTVLSALLFTITRTEIRARTAAERTAADLRRSEEVLLEAHRAKDEFLAVVSHELRTPLNAIVGWVSMLQRGQVSPERQPHAYAVIHRNATAQAALVDDLLDMSRALGGHLRLQFEDVDVAAALRAGLDAVKPAADARGVRLESYAAKDLGTVRADPARLQQVIGNILSNGIKFTPPGGVVRLEAARNWQGVTIRITDTGIGIDPAFLPRVFDLFRQADTSTTRAHGGLGLGLAIARRLMELHGGTITAHSDGRGRGATFVVTIPHTSPG
jgi:signal transduction histidine kinase